MDVNILVMKEHYTNTFTDYNGEDQGVVQDYYVGFTYSDLAVMNDGETLYDPFGYRKVTDSFSKNTGIYQDYDKWWGESDEVRLIFYGYEKLDSIYDYCVTSNLENYTYEENIEE